MGRADILIVGGGVVGCATALQASQDFPDKKIILLEKNSAVGLEASGRNSGVLHSGFHHPVGSLKEKLANKGSRLAKQYASRKEIPLLECGMLIVIPRISSFGEALKNAGLLREMYINGRNQKLRFSILAKKGVKKLEPNVEAVAGIFMPEVAVIDFIAFVKSLYQDALTAGVEFFLNTKVETIRKENDNFVINDRFAAKSIVNCAGMYSDVVAGMAGAGYRQCPIRGEYYQIMEPKKNIVSRLVNPAVPPGHLTKGIHFSPRTDGKMFIGPSFKALDYRDDYEGDRTPPEIFLESVRSFVPDLSVNDLEWGYSGIRAKLDIDRGSDLDFIIKQDTVNPTIINNIGINSPGLSASLAIAQMNCDLLKNNTA